MARSGRWTATSRAVKFDRISRSRWQSLTWAETRQTSRAVGNTIRLEQNVEIGHEAAMALAKERAVEWGVCVRINRIGVEMIRQIVAANG